MNTITGRAYNGIYRDEYLNHVAFPLGGIGAGMICLEGTGALSHVSLRGHPDVFHEPLLFAALCVKGQPNLARVLEGPVPAWKIFFPWDDRHAGAGNGGSGKTYGLPRCAAAEFEARFPFGTVRLYDPRLPLAVEITGWSPFIPGHADDSSLPVAALEYRFANPTAEPVEAVFSFHAHNFMALRPWGPGTGGLAGSAVLATDNGFVLWKAPGEGRPWEQGAFSAVVDDPAVRVNCAWFRGGWFDPLTVLWKTIAAGAAPQAGPFTDGEPSAGGSLYVPFALAPGEAKTITVRLAWHVPETDLSYGKDPQADASSCACAGRPTRHIPWYAARFADVAAVNAYWRQEYDRLRAETAAFTACFYDTDLPPEVIEAVAANLTILKSPTVLRQADGRLWAWEGCFDRAGCCAGTCTHVWNYAQALPHLFPALERTLRETEFGPNQDERGHQVFRAGLPIRPIVHDFHAAADGQLGGIMKVYREWRISGDTDWLRRLWPAVKSSLAYCIETWDPDHRGALFEPHHNTYDIEFWGPDGMCTSFYLGALQAAALMARALGDDASLYEELLAKGRAFMERELWDGEYFIQQVIWQGLRAPDPTQAQSFHTYYSPEALEVLRREGPKYQYGRGCLADGVLGAWLGACCGVPPFLDPAKVAGHVRSVHRYNFKADLSEHVNPQRPTYALGHEAGLVLCTWPKGGEPTLPMVYSNEVWTGFEYQVASHLMMCGYVAEGLEIVRAARRRYDGRVRNPFDEYECGHWYARAMSSYGLLQGLTGVRYDAVDKTLYIRPSLPGDFRAFFCTATGYGTVGVRAGRPFVEVKRGTIPYERIVYEPVGM
ncbi:MAG: non-lysosomal glucosylceramidase [Anaerolineae bacterium]|nr:non-lysosomal glucosylceramidase [Anaerolineae bacterium]